MDLVNCTAWQIADAVRAGQLSAVEVLDHYLARIDEVESDVNAWVRRDADSARAEARDIDRRVAAGEDPGLLAGVPLGVKDVDELRGFRTTWGSLIHAGDPPSEIDGYHIERLRRAGAVFIGKTTTAEFGSAAYTNTILTGVTRNPWNLTRTPGGSSGGASAAVAAGMLPLATGGDGGGSIRLPSHFTGCVGMKATSGRIPTGPARADWSRCVQRGPIGRSVRDNARYIDIASGPHPGDRSTYMGGPTRLESAIGNLNLVGKTAVWTDTMGFGVADPQISAVARGAAEMFVKESGVEEVEREIDWPDPGAAWLMTMALDLGAELQEYLDNPTAEFTPVIQLSLIAVREHLHGPQITAAIDQRLDIERRVAAFFEDVDFIMSPVAPVTAFAAEGPMPTEIAGQSVAATAAAQYTYPFNLTGNPAISIPAGFVDGLPVGLQIVGRYAADEDVIAAAAVAEAALDPWRPAPDPFPPE